MREIKFRTWDGENMIYQGDTHSFNIGGHHGTECLNWLGFNMIGSFKVEELMQFTGLTDVNGTEIYEGDIVEDVEHYYSVISWDSDDFMYIASDVGGLADICHPIKVIGNLYESPELLEN